MKQSLIVSSTGSLNTESLIQLYKKFGFSTKENSGYQIVMER